MLGPRSGQHPMRCLGMALAIRMWLSEIKVWKALKGPWGIVGLQSVFGFPFKDYKSLVGNPFVCMGTTKSQSPYEL